VTIRVYLLRHGPAGVRADWTADDADRPLTASGVRRVTSIAAALAAEGLAPDLILTSPFTRSEQTAAIVADELGRVDAVEVEQLLAPGFAVSDIEGLLHRHAGAKTVLLVGHEPDFSSVTAGLSGARIALQKGGLVEMELDRRRPTEAVLVRLEQPSHLLRKASAS
jgi:phosphohistidine phosphatase